MKNETRANCPADCIKGSIRSYNHEIICDKVKQYFHLKVKRSLNAIRQSIKNGMRIKVVGNLHSATNMLCNKSTIISTKKMKKFMA